MTPPKKAGCPKGITKAAQHAQCKQEQVLIDDIAMEYDKRKKKAGYVVSNNEIGDSDDINGIGDRYSSDEDDNDGIDHHNDIDCYSSDDGIDSYFNAYDGDK